MMLKLKTWKNMSQEKSRSSTYLAADFGAGSGRIIAGVIENKHLTITEIHRFKNTQIKLGNIIYWDFPSLFGNLIEGLKKATTQFGNIKSVAIDTWGVDFGLIDAKGHLLSLPVSYRDSRTEGLKDELLRMINEKEHYNNIGIQPMDINTVNQLLSIKDDGMLKIADKLLFMPDLIGYFLTGKISNEYSIASTSELLNVKTKKWDYDLIDNLGIPKHIFADIVFPGSVLGAIKSEIADEIGAKQQINVISACSHDTASAVAAIPFKEKGNAFLSSGTWSLLGTLIDTPIVADEARVAGFSNEGGDDGKICFLQNITGLWIIQCLIKEYESRNEWFGFDRMYVDASASTIATIIDIDNPIFSKPGNMVDNIINYCKDNNLEIPLSQGDIVRCVLQSLAQRYKSGIINLEKIIDHEIKAITIIGGGSKNKLLNQLTADATGKIVIVGLPEATAIGNILIQAKADKTINSEKESDEIIKNSFDIEYYYPNH